ncbi:MAG: alpha-ribazole phosphatase [Bacteroidota bacterium]
MEIYLIRHTVPKIAKGICYGQTDIELDETRFEEQVRTILHKLPPNLDRVYSSPLARCRRLAQRLPGPVEVDPRLMELDFGRWENKKWEEIDPETLGAWMEDFVRAKAGKGESYLDLHDRTVAFIEALSAKARQDQCLAIVTHAGNIRSFVSYLLGLPLENSFRLQVEHGAVVKGTLGTSRPEHQLSLSC